MDRRRASINFFLHFLLFIIFLPFSFVLCVVCIVIVAFKHFLKFQLFSIFAFYFWRLTLTLYKHHGASFCPAAVSMLSKESGSNNQNINRHTSTATSCQCFLFSYFLFLCVFGEKRGLIAAHCNRTHTQFVCSSAGVVQKHHKEED